MAIDPNNKIQQDSKVGANQANGIVTVNDDNNPTQEERDVKIPNEPDTERLRSEKQSVEEGKRKGKSL